MSPLRIPYIPHIISQVLLHPEAAAPEHQVNQPSWIGGLSIYNQVTIRSEFRHEQFCNLPRSCSSIVPHIVVTLVPGNLPWVSSVIILDGSRPSAVDHVVPGVGSPAECMDTQTLSTWTNRYLQLSMEGLHCPFNIRTHTVAQERAYPTDTELRYSSLSSLDFQSIFFNLK